MKGHILSLLVASFLFSLYARANDDSAVIYAQGDKKVLCVGDVMTVDAEVTEPPPPKDTPIWWCRSRLGSDLRAAWGQSRLGSKPPGVRPYDSK